VIKKIAFLLIFSSFVLGANISKSEALNLIQNNPALLNTPQAKKMMQEQGISKDTIIQKLNSTTQTSNKNNTTKIVNNISKNTDTTITNTTIKELVKVQENPLSYKNNTDIIKSIKSKQNRIKLTQLKRFSNSFFTNKNNINPTSMPVPDYYIINKGDTLSIWIYGGVNKNIDATVDNNGNINIENFGPISVAGLEFKKAKKIIISELSHAFGDANVAVNISSYTTIQVILTGDVYGAGVYNIPSLSTLKTLLIQSGGVKKSGSVRNIVIKRDDKIYKIVDLYALLTGSGKNISTILRSGDIVFVPKASKIVAIGGAVYRPALYELKKNQTLYDLIKYANGLKPNASKYGIKIQRYDDNKNITIKNIDYKNSRTQILQNGDKVYVYNIDAVQKKYIYFYGNVVRPGERGFKPGESLHNILTKEIDSVGLNGVFLDNTLFSYALLKRKDNDLQTNVLSFNLSKIILGEKDIKLRANDEIYIFNKLDSRINPYVIIKGLPVLKSGKYQYYPGLKVSDLIEVAGIKAPYDKTKIKVVTYSNKDFMPKIKIISYDKAINYKLTPYAEVYLFDYYSTNQIPTAIIKGEVNFPKKYRIDKDTTLLGLIKSAGGLTERAYKQKCEIIRYYIKNGKRRKKNIHVSLKDAKKFKIKRFDEVTIFKIPDWNDRKTIQLSGQVKFPGTYVIDDGDKLSDVIDRAGGFTKNAFLYGAVFTRESIRELQRKKLQESLVKLRQRSVIMSNSPRGTGEKKNTNFTEVASMIDSLSKEAQNLKPIGRITIHLDSNLTKFAKSSSNLTLKNGDKLFVPSFNDTVLVMGEVMNPTAIIYNSNDIVYYLKKAGGLSDLADDSNIYVVHANGEAKKYKSGFFSTTMSIKRGDVIVVPQKLVTTTGMQFTKDVAGILYQFAITAASLKTVGAL